MEVGEKMKQGNQFYLLAKIYDENDEALNFDIIKKVQFNIDKITKTYDGINQEVLYDNQKNCFKIYLTEDETFNLKNEILIDARILDKNDMIFGTLVIKKTIIQSVNEVKLDVETESN